MKWLYQAVLFTISLYIYSAVAQPSEPLRQNILAVNDQALSEQTIKDMNAGSFVWKIEKAQQPTSYIAAYIHEGSTDKEPPATLLHAFSQVKTIANINSADKYPFQKIESLQEFLGKALYTKLLDNTFKTSQKILAPTSDALTDEEKQNESNEAKQQLDKYLDKTPIHNAIIGTLVYKNYINAHDYEKYVGRTSNYSSIVNRLVIEAKSPDTECTVLCDKNRISINYPLTSYGYDVDNHSKLFIQYILAQPDNTTYRHFLDSNTIDLFYKNQYVSDMNIFHSQETLRAKVTSFFAKADIDFWFNYACAYLIDHNQTVSPQIQQQAAKEPTLFMVYLDFLYGEQGLLQKLREQGYTVTALTKE